jgi:hypothetical protein
MIDLMELLCVVMRFGCHGSPSHICSCVYCWNLMLTVVGSMLTGLFLLYFSGYVGRCPHVPFVLVVYRVHWRRAAAVLK